MSPTDEEKDELLLSCRYGDLEDIQQFVDKFGAESLNNIRDDSGNSVLHMVCANGHTGVPFPSPANISGRTDPRKVHNRRSRLYVICRFSFVAISTK